MKSLLYDKPVCVLTGHEFLPDEGGLAHSPWGDVLLEMKGIQFAAVKNVLERGSIVLPMDYYSTGSKKQMTGMVAAPILIRDDSFICFVVVIYNLVERRLHLHESFFTKQIPEIAASPQSRKNLYHMLRNSFALAALVGLAAVLDSCTVKEDCFQCPVPVEVEIRVFDISSSGFTKAEASDSPAVSHISFAVFDADGDKVGETLCQESDDSDFGKIAIELMPGTYKFVAVGHSCAGDADINSLEEVVFPGTRPSDTFSIVKEVFVQPAKAFSTALTLARVSSAFVLKINDAIPENVASIVVYLNASGSTPVEGGLKFNPSTGLASGNWKVGRNFLVENIPASQEVTVFTIPFLKDQEVSVKAQALGAGSSVVVEHTIDEIVLASNKRITASGIFFAATGSGSLTFSTAWDEDLEVEY